MIITISRQYSTNGILIARAVAERMGVHMYDRDLIEETARLMQVEPHMLNNLPQFVSTSIGSMLLEWRSSLTPQAYVRYLRVALERIAAEEQNAVILGSGSNFVLQGPNVLKVRIVAPVELRSAIYRAGEEMSDADARRIIEKLDQARVNFIHTVFHEHVENPKHYDLVINLAHFTPEMATEMILDAASRRQLSPTGEGNDATLPNHLRLMAKAHHRIRPEIVEQLDQDDHSGNNNGRP